MKTITVTIDDETCRRARMKASEQDTSVSALVRRFLTEFAAEEGDKESLKREERELRARISSFNAGNRLSRDNAYRRNR